MLEVSYYTIGQAMKMLQISESTLRRGLKSGKIPRAKFCGKVLIPAWFINQGFEREGEHVDYNSDKRTDEGQSS